MPLVAVIGATGSQGGSVVSALSKNPKYKVRAITRNVESDAAKKLASQGIEVVAADVNDEASLEKAFEGAEGIFAVTAYWPSIPALGRDGAGEEEVQQFKNIASAADKTPALKHLVLSTLPNCSKVSGGRFKVPHYDYKQQGVEWIKANRPGLWAKTSEFWPGWYTSNLVRVPRILGFIPVPGTGAYYFVQPSKPGGILPVAGDLETNAGIVVEGLFEKGAAAFGKVAILITEYLPLTEVVAEWSRVTGRRAAYAEATDQAMGTVWGEFGLEIAAQLRWSEEYPDWHSFEPERVIGFEELGVKDKLVGYTAALTALKEQLVADQ
ncbi:NAD(P)-binding protein [Coniochaeta ligniaria NRRL 30616]|uniref:NAD(P)-binding protein n=1 Tax=Coniochaeta ligniaria NRRL 30616 TaxID=1408157 RepID=A0A1J7J1J8_9PEZI|nr:NAD(P)-binding protein [Coniochaeta ligniaria NRRL 30616]